MKQNLDYPYILENYLTPVSDKIIGTRISHYLKYIKKMENLTNRQIYLWQTKKLIDLIHHAYNNTRYYRSLFDNNGISISSITKISDLQKIPILTKKLIKENRESLIPNNIKDIKHIQSSTGGSTGVPLKYLLDINTWSFHAANTIIHWSKAGYRYGDKYLALGSMNLFDNHTTPIKNQIYYKLKGKIAFDGVSMPDKICNEYLNIIKNESIKFVYGYASSIFLLAKFTINNSIKIKLRACFPTSEILTPLYRETIESAFGCEVLNSYGANDGGISSFEHKKGFHEVGYNTIVSQGSHQKDNTFSAQLTDLMNYAMPFINYIPGDEYFVDSDKNKKYFYNGQVINEILGRTSDIIYLDDGNILTGPGFTILFKDLPVDKYKIGVNSSGSIVCKIKRLSDFTDFHADLIINTIKRKAGSGSQVELLYVEDFETNGKRDYFFSD